MKPFIRPLLAAAALLPLLGCLDTSSSGGGYLDTATSVAVTDVDANGRQDVLTSYARSFDDGSFQGFVSSRLGQGTTGIDFGSPLRSNGGQAPGPMILTNLDGDSHGDLVFCDAASTTVTLLYGSATTSGSFGGKVTLALGSNRYAYGAAVADFNGDGEPDIAVAASGGTDLLIFFQNASGGFTGVTPVSLPLGATPYCVAAAALSGGSQDLAVGLSTGQLAILKGNGDGTFQAAVSYACGTAPSAVKVADLDGVNGPDLAVTDYGAASSVLVFLNGGSGAFAAGVSYATGDAYAQDVAIGDLNGDGKPDLAVANSGFPGDPGSLSVLFNNGSGAFGAATTLPGLYGPLSVAIADIDGDGLNDLVSADGTGVVRLQSSVSPGTFEAPVGLYY